MIRLLGVLGAGYGLIAVAVGAFAAHALESRLDERALGWIETGSRYQFFHALALLAILISLFLCLAVFDAICFALAVRVIRRRIEA